MRKVDISIELESPLRNIALCSLLPEAGRPVPRTQVNITETNLGVLITIEAETTNALRGAINSYLCWLDCVISIAKTVDLSQKRDVGQ